MRRLTTFCFCIAATELVQKPKKNNEKPLNLQLPPSASKGKDLCHHAINRIAVMVNVHIKFMVQMMMSRLSVAKLARCAIRTK